MWWMTATAFGAAPSVNLDWKGDTAHLSVVAPAGEKLADDAPSDLLLQWRGRQLQWTAHAGELGTGVALWDVRGEQITGQLEVSLCDAKSGLCRMTEWTLEGRVPELKKGALAMVVQATARPDDAPDHAASPFGPDATADPAEVAFEAATADGGGVLLDFSAAWCPPCNLLAAEVLHAEPAPTELEGWHVAILDVDHASSWVLKDRYDVGGYPTVVAVAADGTELSRVVGYPGEQPFLDWLATAKMSPDAEDLARDPADVGTARAAELAHKLVVAHEMEAAEPWIERASEAPERVPFRMARFGREPSVEDARWLLDNAPERIGEWGGSSLDLAEDYPDVVREVLDASLAATEGPDVADIFWAYAQLESDPADQRRWYGAAAATLRAALSGDPEHDRAYYSWLSRLMEQAGNTEQALAFLGEQARRFPDEPTFELAAATMLNRAERWDESLARSEAALKTAWGDNALRVARARAEALVAVGRADEAKELVQQTLADIPAPEGELDVRTPKYREQLQKVVEPDAE